MKQLRRFPGFMCFVLVGVSAAALHYRIYFLLQKLVNVNIAYTLGYVFGFTANFYPTTYFTFDKKPSWGKAFGFGGVHLFNYLLHIGLPSTFFWLGLFKTTVSASVFVITVPVSFLLVYSVFKYKG